MTITNWYGLAFLPTVMAFCAVLVAVVARIERGDR